MQVPNPFFVRRNTLATALVSVALLTAAGCNNAPSPDVVATVNGKQITRSEVEKVYKANLADNQKEPSQQQSDVMRLNVLRQLVDDEILQQRAAKLNLVATDDEVNAKLTEIKAPYTEDQFNARLKSQSMAIDDLKRDIRRALTTNKLLAKEIESKVNVTDAEVATYYAAHKSDFNLIEPMYHLAQIVVTDGPAAQGQTVNLQNSKATNDADAKKKIQTLHNRLESGEDFSALAMNFSELSATASNGGDMGFVSESQLKNDAEIYGAVGKLKPGQVSDVLPIAREGHTVGYVIIKLIAKEAAGQRELNDPSVQQRIRQELRESRDQLLKNAYYEMLHDQAKIRNYFAEQILKQGAQ